MQSQFNRLLVYVRDMPRAVGFYHDVLGLPLVMQSPGFSQLDLGNGIGLGLHIATGEAKVPEPGWVPSFQVADVKAARERVVAVGCAVALDYHDIPGGVVLEFTDPDGNHVDVMQTGVSCADLGVAVASRR